MTYLGLDSIIFFKIKQIWNIRFFYNWHKHALKTKELQTAKETI